LRTHWRKKPTTFPPPDPTKPVGTDCLPQIQHIVVLMMENHSYDNYFGKLDRGEGFPPGPPPSNPSADGPVSAKHLPSTKQQAHVPTQTWEASHIQWNDGRNDGFPVSIEQTMPGRDATVAMGYWEAADLPFYYGLAGTFPVADRFFSSCLGPTFPNRRFLMAGTANGLATNDLYQMTDYPTNGTIFDVLAQNKISWINYRSAPSPGLILKRLLGIPGLRAARSLGRVVRDAWRGIRRRIARARSDVRAHAQFTADLYPVGLLRFLCHIKPVEQFFRDARNGTLPAVSIVDPEFSRNSEENPQDILLGEHFASRVINAVMQGPGWPGTVLIWCYDEHGGYFDHVPPPPAVEPDDVRARVKTPGVTDRYDRYGFRVPAVVVSPYARPDYVSSAVHDHTSVLKLIETKWNLPALTRRDFEADNLLDCLDLSGPPAFLEPPVLPDSALNTTAAADRR
jgi:phospholipase C